MWTALKTTLVSLLSSRKAVTALIGALTAGLMKLGFDVADDTVAAVLAPIIALIVGQGIADAGKPKTPPEGP